MFVPIREAIAPVSDLSFARRVAGAVIVSTLVVLAAGVFALLRAPRHDRPAMRVELLAAIRTPHLSGIGLATADELELARTELVAYAHEAYPAWAVEHPTRGCPERLLELNTYVPHLHAIDPWGTPYQFLCGAQFIDGLTTRSAGADRAFDTADDLASPR